ncbi:MAG TPA: chromate efflux transporter [Rhizomicrobium sp.]|nr:chromate efflux transporter [Rhizomicrobium sp.]
MHSPLQPALVSAREAFWTWVRVAALSFGGPAGQIAVMHRILVEEKRWISERRFLHALNYCMLLPGPEAQQLAVYIGWLMHRVRGGIIAGMLFILPGLVSLGALSWLYVAYGRIGLVAALFFGLKAAVLAIVLDAVRRIGKRALKSWALVAVAAMAFAGIFVFNLPFPLIILAAGLVGFVGQRFAPGAFQQGGHGAAQADTEGLLDAVFAIGVPAHVRPSAKRFAMIAAAGAALWFAPLAVTLLWLGPGNVFSSIALFNSKMAVVTFGGAYAVLSYMAQQAVQYYHWLKPDEMLVGLGLAETTPGPLISVVQFVGFLAAARQSGAMDPMWAGTLGGLIAMWCTFVPSFLWIFLGAPYVEALTGNKALSAALSAITAAVVGVILNLALWLGLHTLFARMVMAGPFSLPVLESVHWPALIIALAAMVAIFRFGVGVVFVLAGSCLAGMLFYLAGVT